MQIERVLAVPAMGGYYNEDLDAILHGAARDGFFYTGVPVTAGFKRIKEPSEAASIIVLTDSGHIACGDALSVEFAAAAGRMGRFRWQEQASALREVCRYLEGRDVASFLGMCHELEEQDFPANLHRPAAFYGVSQALLQLVAVAAKKTSAEVLADELGVAVADKPIAINVQCGEDRYANADKAILKGADVLPHGLVNDIEHVLGRSGELLCDYVSWLVDRIARHGTDGYQPELHIDVYGLLGQIFSNDIPRIADYITKLGTLAQPYQLCLEAPVMMACRDKQIEACVRLRSELRNRGSAVLIVADEWANNLGDIQAFVDAAATDMINVKSPDLGSVGNAATAISACWQGGTRPILGGSCTDTDQSARVMVHVALASQPAWVLARPGMGVDEGFQIIHNEMMRTLALIHSRPRGAPDETLANRADR